MVYYISSNAYHQSITEAISDVNELVAGSLVGNKINILEFIKREISSMGNVEKMIVDFNGLVNLNDEIIEALEMYRLMYDKTRIIILASGKTPGDELLKQIFHMGIYNIIISSDFNIIREELNHCITVGKAYRDCLEFKESKIEKSGYIKNEVKKTIYKVLIGVTGVQEHIGVTHTCIVLANYLRGRGYRTAICEMSHDGSGKTDYRAIREYFGAEGEISFSGHCIDYYPGMSVGSLRKAMEKSYNFIIADFGFIKKCDLIMFNRCELKMIVSGCRPWEFSKITNVFEQTDLDVLREYHYLFNFAGKGQCNELMQNMKEFSKKVHILNISCNPFESDEFPDGKDIFAAYFEENSMSMGKKSIFSFIKKEKNEKKSSGVQNRLYIES